MRDKKGTTFLKGTFERNVAVINQVKKMNALELDAFMVEFEKGLGEMEVSTEKLAFFLQLLLQMDPQLAERFMETIANKDIQDDK